MGSRFRANQRRPKYLTPYLLFGLFLNMFCSACIALQDPDPVPAHLNCIEASSEHHVMYPEVMTPNTPSTFRDLTILRQHDVTRAKVIKSNTSSHFRHMVLSFPLYREASPRQREDVIRAIFPYAIMPPQVPINTSCLPPDLPDPSTLQCSRYPTAFTGKRRPFPVKIAMISQHGFESDVLEARINEAYDVVDRFFIIEATRAHYGHTKKPLMLEHLLEQPRFYKFNDKIVHFIIDDAPRAGSGFSWENSHEQMRWERFVEWNNLNHYFDPDDIVIFGDSDEIPSREVLFYLKWCEIEGPVDLGTWFTNSDVNTEFRTGYPIPSNHYIWGSPTAHVLKRARGPRGYPTRNRGKSPYFLAGGIHLTYYSYPPFMLLKFWSMTDGDVDGFSTLREMMRKDWSPTELRAKIRHFLSVRWGSWTEHKITGKIEKGGRVIPWFIKCNPGRYPWFFGGKIQDERLTRNIEELDPAM